MKIKTTLKSLSVFEKWLWFASAFVITLAFGFSGGNGLTLLASLLGVSALIFMAKGQPLGQLLMAFFAIAYAIISYSYQYYGEMILYLGKALPVSIVVMIIWLKNPFIDGNPEIRISKVSWRMTGLILCLAPIVTVVFYFVLKAFSTPNLMISTLSITTSFVAASFMYLRSPYFALLFALNDIVLIILWTLATSDSLIYLPMVILFATFLVNDIYAYISWSRIQIRQGLFLERHV